jgi:hypothetical protein
MGCFRWFMAVATVYSAATSAQAQPGAKPAIALENEYVLVGRNMAPCATATKGKCEDRVILAMGDLTLTVGSKKHDMKRAEIAVFGARQSYEIAVGLPFFEIAIKPGHPPITAPAQRNPTPDNPALHQGKTFIVYEEVLPVGGTRPRESHAQRVEIRLNSGPMLRQQVWRDGKMIEIEPALVSWREPVVRVVDNIGDLPLRNFILEFIPQE